MDSPVRIFPVSLPGAPLLDGSFCHFLRVRRFLIDLPVRKFYYLAQIAQILKRPGFARRGGRDLFETWTWEVSAHVQHCYDGSADDRRRCAGLAVPSRV